MSAFIFDLDHTLLTKNSSVEFCRYLYQKKVLSFRSALYCLYYYIKHLWFFDSLENLHQNIFSKVFLGISLPSLQKNLSAFIAEKLPDMWYLPAIKELQLAQRLGKRIIILSSSPDFLVGKIAKMLHVNEWSASQYLLDKEEKFSYIIVMDGEKKACFVKDLYKDIGKDNITAYSDSKEDLPLLLAAGKAVVVNPSRALRKIAQKLGWKEL